MKMGSASCSVLEHLALVILHVSVNLAAERVVAFVTCHYTLLKRYSIQCSSHNN